MATIIPALRYNDAKVAIDWLPTAFGFTVHAVYEDEDGSIVHAEMRQGADFILISSARDDDLRLASPQDGVASVCIYIVIDEVDRHHAQAKAAGAEIIRPPADTPYGSREYSCRDPEGHLWSFGTYAPSL
ncbi:putative glyoxalase superfamily protein PhnB [Rhodoligotrophos appendicifer]|uniref:VOC family protein n=1 Tax=Rhodoligotrophos appendicifer TaxID=987056 RepID=UPI001184E123|nr:VOC family protein [Rhodoligotrophos appendicifer]